MVPWSWQLPKTGQMFPQRIGVSLSLWGYSRDMMVALTMYPKNVGYPYD